ncbi:hypothetical protein Tco_1169026, partial [Tanacetum coccineum]
MPLNQGDDTRNTDAQPNVEAITKDECSKKPARPPTPNLKWIQGKSVDNEPTQTWLNDLANAEKPLLSLNELMSTPIDFSAFAMNHLKISNLIKADLVGSVYNLLKGTCKSYVELEYNMEECRLNVPANFFFNNDLEYLRGGSTDIKYMASTTKTKAAKYDMEGISHWGPKCQRFYGYVINRKSRHDVYSTMRILSVTSVIVDEWYGYGHLKDSKLRTRDVNLSRRAPYTTLSEYQGVIYEDKLKRKRFMDTEELYKFSDGTLTSVRNTLDQMLKNL